LSAVQLRTGTVLVTFTCLFPDRCSRCYSSTGIPTYWNYSVYLSINRTSFFKNMHSAVTAS